MEKPPQFEQEASRPPDWQDILPQGIHELIGEDRLSLALEHAQIRRRGIIGAINEIGQVLEQKPDSAEMNVTPEQWQLEKAELEEELRELTNLIDSIEHDLREE